MKVLVCGGRNYSDADRVYEVLDETHAAMPFTMLIHGAAAGADSLAEQWALETGIPVVRYPANWNRDGKAAGPIRNHQMLKDGKPDMVIAFPGGKGTAHMVRIAMQANVAVREIFK